MGLPKDVRPGELDDIDRRILTTLHVDARISNSALAEAVGIAPSTCHGRVRRLQDIGVIRGSTRTSIRRRSGCLCRR